MGSWMVADWGGDRSPRTSLGDKILDEVWSTNLVSFDHLQVFCCPGYVFVPSDERSKLDPKAKKYIFLGFKKGVKGYKFWDLVKKRVIIYRDAVFDEHYMLQPKKGDTLIDGSNTVEVNIDWISLNERAYNPPTVETREFANSTSTACSSLANL
nr:Retrovirus-related Pol polyprotein from transposon TNT 1-94 [Ipomoea batatas]